MNEATVGRELAAEFHRLMDHEPPFRTDLGEAIRAAEEGGRRRRNQTLALRGGATVLAIAASTALVIAWPGQPRALAPPAVVIPSDVTPTPTPTPTQDMPTPSVTPPSPTRTTPVSTVSTPTRTVGTTTPGKGAPTSTRTTPPAAPLSTMARLERLVRQVAAPAGGVATVTTRNAVDKTVVLSVETEAGYFQVSASMNDGTLDTARQMCVSEGDLCTTQWSSETAGAWLRGYSDQPGRENLLFVMTYPQGLSLWLGTSNWHPSGTKPLGPSSEEVGITVPLLRQAESDAGLNGSS